MMRYLLPLLAYVSLSSAFVSPGWNGVNRRMNDAITVLEASSRREFIQKTTAASQAAIASSLWFPSQSASAASGSTLDLPPMGLGAWAWGDSLFWGYSPTEDEELRRVFDYAVANSKSEKTLFDTAELYGLGRSESLLGKFSQSCPDKVQIATKFAPFPLRDTATSLIKACEASSKRLGGKPIDLYQIHFPNAWNNADFWDGLAIVYEKGLVKNVGVSNYGSDAVRACHKALAERGIPLATNQIQYSLLYQYPEINGLLETCKELDVKVLAYSPLALGYLTGKYTPEKLPSGPRNGIGKQLFKSPDYQNLLDTMAEIASKHSGGTLSQVAINWTRAKGTIPIPGARTISQVQQNYNALDWNLSTTDMQTLDKAAEKVTTFVSPDKSPFPKEDKNTHLKMFDS